MIKRGLLVRIRYSMPNDGGYYPGMILRFPLVAILITLLSSRTVAQTNPPQQTQISESISQGLLITKVQPTYPPLARQARVQGTVALQALIRKDGTVQELTVISGHPMLIQAAMEAVKQWRYKPYLLDGEPVLVQTTINVNFELNPAAPATTPHQPTANSSSPGSGPSNPPPTPQGGQSVASEQNSAVYRVGKDVSPPKVTYAPDPEYSDEAQAARYQGTVVLWLVVDADGSPQKIKVQRSLGMGLDEEAIKAVKQWKFEPATRAGQPVAVMINVEVNFRLYDLVPHPDSARQPPRFPGVNTSKYPLVVRLKPVLVRVSATSTIAGYHATVINAGQQQEVTISCTQSWPQCKSLLDGTYPARWEDNLKTIEIMGVLGSTGKWEKAEYTVGGEEH